MKNVIDIFAEFNKKEIKYFILRDFSSLKKIEDSADIDIYVDKHFKKCLHELLLKDGWYTDRFNDNKYSHIQYTKLLQNRIVKLDFVFELRYGKSNYYINEKIFKLNLNSFRTLENIHINSYYNSIVTMLFHIIFDKEYLSEKNYEIFKEMYNEFNRYEKEEHNRFIESICNEILNNDIDYTNKKIKYFQKIILDKKILKKSVVCNLFDDIRKNFCTIINKFRRKLSKKSIAIIGVDGSGKSTAIKTLNYIYGEKSKIVYMGLKEFRLKKLNTIMEKMNNYDSLKSLEKLYFKFLLWLELNFRYYKNRFSSKIIVYDRYIEDYFINSIGKGKLLDIIIYKYLYPKASVYFYFYCDAETSFNRKDDISNKDEFKKMKARYDEYFINKKNVYKVNTDEFNEEQVVEFICDCMNKYKSDFSY